MKIGILGTGIVGQTLGLKFIQLGHSVILGTRDPSNLNEPKGHGPNANARTLGNWLAEAGSRASVATFSDAAAQSELVINATSGSASVEVLHSVGAEHLNGKTVIDTSNPIDFSRGFPLTLFVKDTDSLGEILQREFPDVRIVKTLNTMASMVMVNPAGIGNGDPTVFLSGNDSAAKTQVAKLLRELGWSDIIDLGDITTARGQEMMLPIGHALFRALNTFELAFKVVR